MNPSDVRKAIHDEQLSNADPKLAVLKKLLFGFWEMNWVALNNGNDLLLPGDNARQAFFAHPKVLLDQQALDSLNPLFTPYTISTRSL